MAGLLDIMDDPVTAGALGLLSAAGPSRMPVSVGQALGQGYGAFQQQQRNMQDRGMNDLKTQLMRGQLDEHRYATDARAKQQQFLDQFRAQLPPEYRNLPDAMLMDLMKRMYTPKEAKYEKVDNTLVKIDDSGVSPVFTAPPDPYKMSKKDELEQRHQDRLAEIRAAAMLRPPTPEKIVTVMDESGNPISMAQSEALASKLPIYTPSAAKVIREKQSINDAKQQMSDTVSELKGYYDTLKEGGGIASTGNSVFDNLAAKLSSSGIGQAAGSAIGTENQSTRQKIVMTRPALMNLIKQSTGMSAQQMNSNAELMLYLKTATDPDALYEANINALRYLDKTFGLGLLGGSNNSASGKIGQKFDTLPKANEFKGKRMRGPDGTIYRSNGMSWVKE